MSEDRDSLCVLNYSGKDSDCLSKVNNGLKQDKAVLLKNISMNEAETLLGDVVSQLGLQDNLKMQSALASVHQHRESKGKYFMSVNKRSNNQFIPFHSEGTSKSQLQLAAMFCAENSTNGGTSIIARVKQEDDIWQQLKEFSVKVKLGSKIPSPQAIEQAKVFLKVDLLRDRIKQDDEVLDHIPECHLNNLKSLDIVGFKVLSKPKKSFSRILGEKVYSYWDSIGSYDFASAREYLSMLEKENLLKTVPDPTDLSNLDNAHNRRVWDSQLHYKDIFECKVTHKLSNNELLIFNNMTWAHSSTSWEHGSGNRAVYAAFA
ncbi:hypothetical protein J8L73_17745 [Pseudoalteromonas sp. MMG006]|uniref:hypothetical protein n=1 Tax=unclassified Pseudoalteromonas TaxID=194690 RepID=UPI001B3603C4|nr:MULTISPECIES: hypothetical protein [unclassified Pseudoalteromonas]MBQ4800943.1 hypothetical protein [Pseudoalteromonas sp. MMG006]MCH2089909.1 hypothetical protein [Pseudoalteromonas sp.]